MKQIKLDEYNKAVQNKIESMGYSIVLVMFKQRHVVVIVK